MYRLFAVLLLCAGAAHAAPRVVTDIPPVQSLTARVMKGVGSPAGLLPPGASPHRYALKPSDARALSAAALVVWVGPELEPWLDEALDSLAADAPRLTLTAVPGVVTLPRREDARFEAHHHHEGAHEAHHDEHEMHHDDAAHEDHEHEAHAAGEHDHHDDHDDHDHGANDPHLWLDPVNAALWMEAIAQKLAELDPANAEAYRANAAAGRAELEALQAELRAELAPVADKGYIVFHDAYHYFENRFGVNAVGAISIGDARAPSAARIQALRDLVQETGAVCVFTEPQYPAGLARTVAEGSGVTIGSLDPLGAALAPGAGQYPALLRAMARDLVACLR